MLLWTSPEIQGFAIKKARSLYPQVRSIIGLRDILQEFALGFVSVSNYFDASIAEDEDKALMALFKRKVSWISADLVRKSVTASKQKTVSSLSSIEDDENSLLEPGTPDEVDHRMRLAEIIEAQPEPLQNLINACLAGSQGSQRVEFNLHAELSGTNPWHISGMKSKFRKEMLTSCQ